MSKFKTIVLNATSEFRHHNFTS